MFSLARAFSLSPASILSLSPPPLPPPFLLGVPLLMPLLTYCSLASYFNTRVCVGHTLYATTERSIIMCISYRLHTRHLAFHLLYTAFELYNQFVIRETSETRRSGWKKTNNSNKHEERILYWFTSKAKCPYADAVFRINSHINYRLSLLLFFCWLHNPNEIVICAYTHTHISTKAAWP